MTQETRIWSPQQLAIFQDIETGSGHTVVVARAGSGKTSTLVEGFNYVGSHETVLMCAFSKAIQEELEKRAPFGVKVHTMHSFGLLCTRTHLKKSIPVVKDKLDKLILEVVGDDPIHSDLRYSLKRCVSLAKGSLASTPEEIDEIIDLHQISPPETMLERPRFISTVLELLKLSLRDLSCVDFDDMVWLAVEADIKIQQFDRVFIDETQDLNNAQIQLALSACKPGGRILAVGDDRQAIFAFRGADSGAVKNVINQLDAKVLSLSTTYRCGKAIVTQAQRFVPDISAPPAAHEGNVSRSNLETLRADAVPGDVVLSRVNAPLIGLCMGFLREGKPANILGRDVSHRLLTLIKASKTKTAADLRRYVYEWAAAEVVRLEQIGRSTAAVEDIADCLVMLCEGNTTVNDVVMTINKLFEGKDGSRGKITLSSTHKAKGLEWDRVWMLEATYLRRSRRGKALSPEAWQEEENLAYVAVTRARRELVMVEGDIR